MEYLTVKEAGEKCGITARMVTYYCSASPPDTVLTMLIFYHPVL